MKKTFTLVLGVVTSIGGFVEAGSISTAAQAGAEFGFALLWAIAVATVILACLAEMSGRIAAVGHRSMAAAVRERFGIHYQIIPLGAELILGAGRGQSYSIRPNQLDLSDPERPRLTCALRDVRRVE